MSKRMALFFVCWLAACSFVKSNTELGHQTAFAAENKETTLVVSDSQKQAYRLLGNLLPNHHYHRLSLKEAADSIHTDFLDALDSGRSYFLQSDIDEFEAFRGVLVESMAKGDLSHIVAIYQRYAQRFEALNTWTIERLKQDIDLDKKDYFIEHHYQEDDKPAYPQTFEQAQERQEKRLIDVLIRMILGGKTKEQAIASLLRRHESLLRQREQFSMQDLFDIYANVITHRFDPHTAYLSPRQAEDFDIGMRLELQGIGAVLTIRDEMITVRELSAGGPAQRDGRLQPKDKILGVAQGVDGEMVDVINWRLDKAITLIRGKKGTIVRLLIEPGNGNPTYELSLERDVIRLEEQAAKAEIEVYRDKEGKEHQIGVIKLPSFYMDFDGAREGNENYRSTSRDLERLIRELERAEVEGILLDLRGNGGGSLQEAVQAVGLFVKEGPVVRISDARGKVRDELIEQVAKVYDGPLGVMINAFSASASEIFAAAVQDYDRAIVIGSTSYGKGTVQSVMELGRFLPKKSKVRALLGEVKFTVAMFHRITGASTQLAGVTPDVALLDINHGKKLGERGEKYVLPSKQVAAAKYVSTQRIDAPMRQALQAQQQSRFTQDAVLKRYREYVQRLKARAEQRVWSLNLEERRKEYEDWKAYEMQYEEAQLRDIPALKSDVERREEVNKRNRVAEENTEAERFVPDVELFEGLIIFGDYLKALEQKNLAEQEAVKPAA